MIDIVTEACCCWQLLVLFIVLLCVCVSLFDYDWLVVLGIVGVLVCGLCRFNFVVCLWECVFTFAELVWWVVVFDCFTCFVVWLVGFVLLFGCIGGGFVYRVVGCCWLIRFGFFDDLLWRFWFGFWFVTRVVVRWCLIWV